MNIALYVQHLLGTGHLVRTKLLADALHQADHQVTLITGGFSQQQNNIAYKVIQLPPLKTNPGDFRTLIDEHNTPVNENWKTNRKQQLLNTTESLTLDAVIIETWPFGRKQMEFEILPLVESLIARKNPPQIISSIRDILQTRSSEKNQKTLKRLSQYFNLVLVHGDPQLVTLKSSFPEQDQIPCEIEYSGYITTARSHQEQLKQTNHYQDNEVLVSSGGGAAGLQLLQTAAKASQGDQRHWRLLVGHNLNQEHFDQLPDLGGQNLIVERNRSDFPTLLKNCAVSVSQFGYNTALDIIHADCKAVIIPYAEGGETEQTMRAECFAEKNQVVVQTEQTLTPENLLVAVNKAATMTKQKLPINTNGANTSVKILEQHLKNHQS